MPKPRLTPEYENLCSDIMETMRAGLKQWRNDLDYPQSSSDRRGEVMALLQMFEIKRRPIALREEDICEKEKASMKTINQLWHELYFALWVGGSAHEAAMPIVEEIQTRLLQGEVPRVEIDDAEFSGLIEFIRAAVQRNVATVNLAIIKPVVSKDWLDYVKAEIVKPKNWVEELGDPATPVQSPTVKAMHSFAEAANDHSDDVDEGNH